VRVCRNESGVHNVCKDIVSVMCMCDAMGVVSIMCMCDTMRVCGGYDW